MPVIVVTAPALAHPEAALVAVNVAVTSALGLPSDAAHAMHVIADGAATGIEASTPWPTAVVHGGPRSPAEMQAVEHALAGVLMHYWRRPPDEVWVQWAVRAQP